MKKMILVLYTSYLIFQIFWDFTAIFLSLAFDLILFWFEEVHYMVSSLLNFLWCVSRPSPGPTRWVSLVRREPVPSAAAGYHSDGAGQIQLTPGPFGPVAHPRLSADWLCLSLPGQGWGGVIPPARVAGSAVSSVSSIRHCLAHFKAFLLEAYVLFIDMSARKTNPSSPRSARFVPGVLFGVLLGVLGDSGALVRCPILVLENPAPLLHQMFP